MARATRGAPRGIESSYLRRAAPATDIRAWCAMASATAGWRRASRAAPASCAMLRSRRAEQGNERRSRVRRDRQVGRAHLLVHEPTKIALAVRIAGNHRGALGALARDAQRRVAFQVAGFDHHPAIADLDGEQSFDAGHDVARADAQMHGASATE